MAPSKLPLFARLTRLPLLPLLALGFSLAWQAGCQRAKTAPPPPSAPGEIVQLNAIPVEQLRVMLKGFPGEWRPDSDRQRGLPAPPAQKPVPADVRRIALVAPEEFRVGELSVRRAIQMRRSARAFAKEPLTLEELSYLLWATQGITSPAGEAGAGERLRAAPSAGARYPLETYLAIDRVEGLRPGLYRYLPGEHQLILLRETADLRAALQQACYGQAFVADAAVVFLWTAIPYRTEWKYTYTSHRMIAMEAGHVCENLCLAAESCGVAACPLLGYHQPALDELLGVDGKEEFTLYLACIGKPAPQQP